MVTCGPCLTTADVSFHDSGKSEVISLVQLYDTLFTSHVISDAVTGSNLPNNFLLEVVVG